MHPCDLAQLRFVSIMTAGYLAMGIVHLIFRRKNTTPKR